MELDATEKKVEGRKGPGGPKKEITCYACNKKGHMAKDCRSKNKVHRGQFNAITRREINMIARPNGKGNQAKHNNTHWSFCNDDDCEAHASLKKANQWTPKRKDHSSIPWHQCTTDRCNEH
jgi:hypothetical protein